MTTVETEPRSRRWSYQEYYQMGDLGFFQGQRVKLIDGEIVEKAPQGNVHSVVVGLCQTCLQKVFGDNFWVRAQLPLRFPKQFSEPEPDISVVVGAPRDYLQGHPSTAQLVVEVSETTLGYDRGRKANLYASVGIEDYWIVNLTQRQIERCRQPIADAAEPFGWRYAKTDVFKPEDVISPLAAPNSSIRVAELLP